MTWLERNGHADAAASGREGLEETLTGLKPGTCGGGGSDSACSAPPRGFRRIKRHAELGALVTA